jgi:hypothetical protein
MRGPLKKPFEIARRIAAAELPSFADAIQTRDRLKAERIKALPKWAQQHIHELEERVHAAENTLPWTEPNMEWYLVMCSEAQLKLFTLSKEGAMPIFTLFEGDKVFIGRAKRG